MDEKKEESVQVYVNTAGGNAAFHNFINDFAHIEDPLERRRLALNKIDSAKFGWYHIRAIIVGGVGFMTDSYDLFSIGLITSMLGFAFWPTSEIPDSTSTLIKASTSVGTVIGQFGFGILADVFGRKKIYGSELLLITAFTILQCMLGSSPAVSFVATFVTCRIGMGIGIGGDYPLSSIITSEFATTKWRGATMGAVFANQAWGQVAAGLVALIVVAAYKDDLINSPTTACDDVCQKACDQMWRILVGMGCVPGLIALYFRLTIPESPRYSLDVDFNVGTTNIGEAKYVSNEGSSGEQEEIARLEKAPTAVEQMEQTIPKASFKDFRRHFSKWRHMKILIGTAGSWFFTNVAFYGVSLNTPIILNTIGYSSSENVYANLYDSAVGNLILICAGSLPGYWASVATVDIVGRKPIQLMGFIANVGIFCAIGFAYDKLGDSGLLTLYVFAQFFSNFGPNTTTFIVPGEAFPTRYRSSAHGISAACGKIGAIIAQTALGTLINYHCSSDEEYCWLPHVMEIFALFMLGGIFTTLLIPETKRMTLEAIAEKYHGEIDPCKLAPNKEEKSDSASTQIETV